MQALLTEENMLFCCSTRSSVDIFTAFLFSLVSVSVWDADVVELRADTVDKLSMGFNDTTQDTMCMCKNIK